MTACTWPLGRDAGQDSAAEYHHLQCRDHSGKRAGNGNLHLASWLRWRQGQCSKIPSPTAPRSCWRDGLAAAPLCRGAEQLDGLGRSQRPRLVTPLHILPGRPSPWEPSPGLGLTLRPSTHGSFLPDWVRWDWIRVERICTLPHSLHILPGRPSPWELSPGLGLTLPHMGTFSQIGLDGIGFSRGGHPYGLLADLLAAMATDSAARRRHLHRCDPCLRADCTPSVWCCDGPATDSAAQGLSCFGKLISSSIKTCVCDISPKGLQWRCICKQIDCDPCLPRCS